VRALAASGVAALAVVVAACGNFFPNPDNVVLPSGLRDYALLCGTVPRGECETRAASIVDQKRTEQPHNRVVKVEIQARGSYTITFADGNTESLIVD
jgi:hypothetical protein